MGTIEKWLRDGIRKTDAVDIEGRNRVYLAARQTILRFPAERQPDLLTELQQAVETIEFEIAKMELARKKTAPEPAKDPGYVERLLASEDEIAALAFGAPATSRAFKFAAVAIVLLAVGLGGTLLWRQFFLDPLAVASVGDDPALSALSDATEQALPEAETANTPKTGMRTLFAYNERTQLASLSNSPTGDVPLVPSGLDDPQTPDISLPVPAQVYTARPLTVNHDKLYLMRFELRVEPPDVNFEVQGGFSTTGEGGETQEVFFVHDGPVARTNPRAGNGVYLFSGIADWKTIRTGLGGRAGKREVRPAIKAQSGSDNIRFWLVSMTLNEL